MEKFRKPETLKRKIDSLAKKYGRENIILDHGVGSYRFSRYEYEEASLKNNYSSTLKLFYEDFNDAKTERLYMSLTAEDMRKPTKDDYGREFVFCIWEKEYPRILEIREYTIRL